MRKTLLLIAVLLMVPISNAQVVGADYQKEKYTEPTVTRDDAGRPRGALLHLEIGTPTAVSLGYQISPVLMVGAGIGANFILESAPLFAEVRLNTPHSRLAGFIDFKAGYDLGGMQGYTAMGEVGILYGKYFGIGMGVGYTEAWETAMFLMSVSCDIKLNKLFY